MPGINKFEKIVAVTAAISLIGVVAVVIWSSGRRRGVSQKSNFVWRDQDVDKVKNLGILSNINAKLQGIIAMDGNETKEDLQKQFDDLQALMQS